MATVLRSPNYGRRRSWNSGKVFRLRVTPVKVCFNHGGMLPDRTAVRRDGASRIEARWLDDRYAEKATTVMLCAFPIGATACRLALSPPGFSVLAVSSSDASFALLLLLLVANLCVVTWIAIRYQRDRRPRTGGDHGISQTNNELSEVMTAADQTTAVLQQAGTIMDRGTAATNALRSATIRFATSQWQLSTRQQKCVDNLAKSLIAIIDHVEATKRAKTAEPSDSGSQLQEIARRGLAEVGIKEITVAVGDAFDGRCHMAFARRPGTTPPNTIAEVVQLGYVLKQADVEVILRPTTVVISEGQLADEHQHSAPDTGVASNVPNGSLNSIEGGANDKGPTSTASSRERLPTERGAP